MKKIFTLIGLGVFLVFQVSFAQTSTEALRLSASWPLGTARNLGTGNSMFAIGPDFSAIGSNPSGIAGFWKSEFVFSAGVLATQFNSGFSGDSNVITEDDYSHLSLPNIGFVIVDRPWDGNWKTSNWVVGFNRVADYRKQIQFAGRTTGSMTDSWRENAAGKDSSQLNGFEEGLAWSSGAIYDFERDHIYETDYQLSPQNKLLKRENTTIDGGKSELFLGYGANYDDKLWFGFTINLPLVSFTEDRTYREQDGEENGIPYFNELTYTSYINTTGYGINGKVGLTFKPLSTVHLALALHSPTRFQLTDDYNTTLSYDYTDGNHDGPIRSESPYGSFQYALRTPWSFSGGVGIIAGTHGFISGSLKWTDYSSMQYDYSVQGNGNQFEQEEREVNQDIKQTYGSAIDLNIGGELALEKWRLRAGVALAQSVYANDETFDPSYHAGIGYRDESYFIDLGYRLSEADEGYLPYETIDAPQPFVVNDYTRHYVTMTLGLKF